MRLIVSGEGPTDIGTTRPGPGGNEFVPGPMTCIVDTLLVEQLGYSQLEQDQAGGECIRHVSEREVAAHGRPGPLLLPGIKHGKGMAFFTRNAQVLGLLAKQDATEHQCPVIAVLFRDGDGTRSADDWRQKFESIRRGFQLAQFDCGVPMVPRPKSEAWLLCALKHQPYQGCTALEDAPGNDVSLRALKRQLAEAVGHEANAQEQAAWIRELRVDPRRIDMPSFNEFKAELDRAADVALSV